MAAEFVRLRSRIGRRSPEWRWQGRGKATNRIPDVKGVLKNRIEIEVPGSQTSCNRLIPYALHQAEGIPETVYRSLCFYVAGWNYARSERKVGASQDEGGQERLCLSPFNILYDFASGSPLASRPLDHPDGSMRQVMRASIFCVPPRARSRILSDCSFGFPVYRRSGAIY